MSDCGIYKIINTITGDYYIGSASNIRKRMCIHRWRLANNTHENGHLQRVWNKYGTDKLKFTVLLYCSIERKLQIEQGMLDLFKPAYNIATCAGAPMQGLHHTSETRAKISEANVGHNVTTETRTKLSEANKGNTSALGYKFTDEERAKNSALQKGKHLSEETRRKMSEAHEGKPSGMLGKHHTEEAKQHMSAAHVGHATSEETKRKISAARKGKPNGRLGMHLSEETKRRISAARKLRFEKETK